jgi:hypothetical protein
VALSFLISVASTGITFQTSLVSPSLVTLALRLLSDRNKLGDELSEIKKFQPQSVAIAVTDLIWLCIVIS